MISFFSQYEKFDVTAKRALKNWLKAVVESEHKRAREVSFIFCSDDELLQINRQYLQHNYFTDVITFDYSEGMSVSGDIFISIDTVRANAATYRQAFTDELHRVMLHGVLHLCGYKDKTAAQKKLMRAKEDFYLAKR